MMEIRHPLAWSISGAIVLVLGAAGLSIRALGKPITAPVGWTSPSPTLSTEGSIIGVDVKSPQPSLLLAEKEGEILTLKIDRDIPLDPNATLISENGQVVQMDRLEKGQHVKVRYTIKGGKGVAKYIEIVAPQPMPDFPKKDSLR